jgi:co-chaperonin GroES (HSP10)
MRFPVTPLGELCFIEPEAQARTIHILDERQALRGRVIARGPGRPMPDGSSAPMSVRVGDMVRIKQGNAVEAFFDQKRHWIVRESDLLAVEI